MILHTPWWREAVVYQIYPRSFADSNGDGVGDLPGITSRLDYLAELGVDALWLSPIFRSPMADFGYDVADYCSVDPVFGTNRDLDELIEGVHARNMRLLLDWVPNHTSDQHPWFIESRSSCDNPKRDWYIWRDRRPDGSLPNNWLASFKGVPAWTYDERTGQCYLHLFLAQQPDLNWANPAVEAAMHDTLRFWLDRGVDGFRADVVHLIGKGTDLHDLEGEPRSPVLEIDTDHGHACLRRIRKLLDGYPHTPMMVGEVYLLGDGQSVRYLGDPATGRGELHLSFDFRPVHADWEALAGVINRCQRDFAEPAWPTWVLSNHDQRRHRTRYGSEARARAAAVVSLTVRGTPFLYAGEELGLEDAVIPAHRAVDPDNRDGCRAPIPWTSDGDDEVGHGWNTTKGTRPWLPFPANAGTHAAVRQVGVEGSMHTLYKSLLSLRKSRDTLRRGSMSPVVTAGLALHYERQLGDDRIAVVVNLADEPTSWPAEIGGEVLVSTHERSAVGGKLAGCEAVVVQR